MARSAPLCKVQLLTPVCDNYNISDLKRQSDKRRSTVPAVRKQTTAAFLTALSEGNIKTVLLMLDSHISVTATDKLGRTALHLAICLKQNNTALQICRSLLARGSDVNCGDVFGMTPFSYAVSSQNITMVREMLKSAKVDKTDKFGNTSLHHAAATGNSYLTGAIGKLTRQLNKLNILGFTPLMIASKLGYDPLVKSLAALGAGTGRTDLSSGEEWSRFSSRFSESDITDLVKAEQALSRNINSPALQRSEHPDCGGTVTGEVYRATSRTLPIFVTSGGGDQTQLIIKRVLLLRKLSKFLQSSKIQVKGGRVYETRNGFAGGGGGGGGNVSSISVNDLLDEHLSKLTLDQSKEEKGKKVRRSVKKKIPTEEGDSGSDDSILIRQAKEIEKGTLKRRRQQKQAQARGERKKQLEPSIVTLVHSHTLNTPKNSVASRDASPIPSSKINHLNMTPSEISAKTEVLLPDCTTVDSPFVRPPSDIIPNDPLRVYHRNKQTETLLLCEKVRYGQRTKNELPSPRVGESPVRGGAVYAAYCKQKKRKKGKTRRTGDPMKGFGPWVTE